MSYSRFHEAFHLSKIRLSTKIMFLEYRFCVLLFKKKIECLLNKQYDEIKHFTEK